MAAQDVHRLSDATSGCRRPRRLGGRWLALLAALGLHLAAPARGQVDFGFPPVPYPPPGDVDLDQRTTVADARLLLAMAVGLVAPTQTQKRAGDIDKDGALSAPDVVPVLRYVAGLEEVRFEVVGVSFVPGFGGTEMLARSARLVVTGRVLRFTGAGHSPSGFPNVYQDAELEVLRILRAPQDAAISSGDRITLRGAGGFVRVLPTNVRGKPVTHALFCLACSVFEEGEQALLFLEPSSLWGLPGGAWSPVAMGAGHWRDADDGRYGALRMTVDEVLELLQTPTGSPGAEWVPTTGPATRGPRRTSPVRVS